ncbi:hypothetical protein [Clostridium psychrophilum]|uniref:hypothetical protein n=1 Tax=Clostridium psychrophilum TaxID=132926 RepID=UPI001C0D8299|nr:hypothetical protein [Clostridium psychrophilum]MBU3182624.1 hypothetical protein [Clostridium psychrophilum]
MKTKLSLRKKIVMQTIVPDIVIIVCGVLANMQNGLLNNIMGLFAIVLLLFMFIYTNRKKSEPTDEMAKQNQLKAGKLSYTITLAMFGLVMLYALKFKTSVIISMPVLVYGFVCIHILNLAIFLFYDIRGN